MSYSPYIFIVTALIAAVLVEYEFTVCFFENVCNACAEFFDRIAGRDSRNIIMLVSVHTDAMTDQCRKSKRCSCFSRYKFKVTGLLVLVNCSAGFNDLSVCKGGSIECRITSQI